MFESRISPGGIEKLPYHSLKILVFLHGLVTWLVMQRSVWNDIVNCQKQLYKTYLLHASMTTTSKKKKRKFTVGELSHVCSQTVLKCLYLARIGRPDILWSVNKLARSITKWTKACDKRLINWFHIFIILVNTNNIVMWVTLQNNADWDYFKTLSRKIMKIQNPLLEEPCAYWEVIHLFKEIGCARNKLLFLTVQQNLKSSLWTLDGDWMGCLLWNYAI